MSALLDASGMTRREFAEAIGTPASRLSTHLSGKVAPFSTRLVRMERVVSRQPPPDARRPGT